MDTVEQTVQVTLQLPIKVYQQVTQIASHEQQRPEEMLRQLIADGLDTRMSVRQQLERISKRYRARLARQRKLDQSPDEVLQDLHQLREQVADELYP